MFSEEGGETTQIKRSSERHIEFPAKGERVRTRLRNGADGR